VTEIRTFPLIQLPRKSEVALILFDIGWLVYVSINSTSEEVRSADIRAAMDSMASFH